MKYMLQGVFLMLLLAFSCYANAQKDQSEIDRLASLPSSFFNKVNRKLAGLDKDLDNKTDKYLEQLVNKEKKLQRKLSQIDSNSAKRLNMENPTDVYGHYITKFKPAGEKESSSLTGEYMPYVDSLNSSLNFLNKNSSAFPSSKESAALQQSLVQIR